MTGQRSRWGCWLRAAGAVAFAYLMLIQFVLAPLSMMRAHAAATGQDLVLCIDGHRSGPSEDQSGGGHDCTDCCLNRVATAPFVVPSSSQFVVPALAPLSDGTGFPASDARGPPSEAWSDQKSQRGPPARA